MIDFNTPEFQAKLVTSEGQNVMARHFLSHICAHQHITVGDMIVLLKQDGWEDPRPRIWPSLHDKEIINLEDTQRWLRWILSLELGKEVGYMLRTGHGTRFSETPVNFVVGWTKLYDREGPKDEPQP